jgi:hypothetical protein
MKPLNLFHEVVNSGEHLAFPLCELFGAGLLV